VLRNLAYRTKRGQLHATQVDDGLQDLVLRLDRLRIGLIDALRGDHVDQLGGQVDVRFLERAGLQHAEVAVARDADERVARREGASPGVAAERLQALRVAKARDLDLAGGLGLAVRVARHDDAVASNCTPISWPDA
jgi:hypothetical protein